MKSGCGAKRGAKASSRLAWQLSAATAVLRLILSLDVAVLGLGQRRLLCQRTCTLEAQPSHALTRNVTGGRYSALIPLAGFRKHPSKPPLPNIPTALFPPRYLLCATPTSVHSGRQPMIPTLPAAFISCLFTRPFGDSLPLAPRLCLPSRNRLQPQLLILIDDQASCFSSESLASVLSFVLDPVRASLPWMSCRLSPTMSARW